MTRYTRNVGDVFTVPCSKGRKFIKLESGTIPYAAYVAMNNQDICGRWFEGCEVHHVDYDFTNDVPENLVCVTPEEHRLLHSKPFIAYKNDKEIGVYRNQIEAEEELGIAKRYISRYLKRGIALPEFYQDSKAYRFELVDNARRTEIFKPMIEQIRNGKYHDRRQSEVPRTA